MNITFYTAFGALTCAFAQMEADLRVLISGVAFGGDNVIGSAFLDGSQLGENLSILRKLSRKFWTAKERFNSIIRRIQSIRFKRNLFIYGLCSPREFGEENDFAHVRDLRTVYEESKTWKQGISAKFLIEDFKEILDEVTQISAEIEALCESLENEEETEFGAFQSTFMSKPIRVRMNLDGSLNQVHDENN